MPGSERGQGARQPIPARAIDEAATDGVNLNSDRDEGKATTAGSATSEDD